MAARCLLVALVLSVSSPAALAAQGHPAPSPEIVRDLRHHHRRGDWWRITTDSTRYEARVSEIDGGGLGGFTVARKAPRMPDRIAWDSIARIDLRKSHERRGQITWMILGMSAAFIPLANGNDDTNQPRLYMMGGAIAGSYLGRALGARNVHERALYVAPTPVAPSTATPVVVAADTASTGAPAGAAPATTVTIAAHDASTALPRPTDARAIALASRRISSHELLRIQGDFGTFYGYASTIGPDGLGGLRVEPRYPSVQVPGIVRWDRIDRLELRGSNAGRGALKGALGLGMFTGLLGFPIGSLANSQTDANVAGVVVACAGVGACVGMLLGAGIGSASSSWHLVYQRP